MIDGAPSGLARFHAMETSVKDPAHVAAADQQVLITRSFDAPREQMFKAWTDPDQVAVWYRPGHFDTPRERIHIDLRVGGRYELTMVQRDSGHGLRRPGTGTSRTCLNRGRAGQCGDASPDPRLGAVAPPVGQYRDRFSPAHTGITSRL
jgi:Activator of Hsp90 ATPase homolog 1-like protein